jgi:hypothetical protein
MSAFSMITLKRHACDHAITPDFSIIEGLEPKFSGFQRTRSASVPGATCPTRWLMPCVIALIYRQPKTLTNVNEFSRINSILGDITLDSRVVYGLAIAQG